MTHSWGIQNGALIALAAIWLVAVPACGRIGYQGSNGSDEGSATEQLMLSVEDAGGGLGRPMAATLEAFTGQQVRLFAVVRTTEGAFVEDYPASWSLDSGGASLEPGPFTSSLFVAHEPGAWAITATSEPHGIATIAVTTSLCATAADCAAPCFSTADCVLGSCVTGPADKDSDKDGFIDAACGGDDCDDDPAGCGAACAPGNPELCDGRDNNCDQVDDEAAMVCTASGAFLQISMGTAHGCGITPSRDLYCWGGDKYGQLGDGADLTDQLSPAPVDTSLVTGATTWKLVRAGNFHTCAITTEGVPYCWGDDSQGGMLGNGSADASPIPMPVDRSTVTGLTSFADIATGMTHSCGITVEGIAYCWGTNSSGELGKGNGSGTQLPTAVDTSTITGDTTFARISAGDGHTCGITGDGIPYCWGGDDLGDLGNGDGGSSSRPVPVDTSTIPGVKTFTDIIAGWDHSCGITGDGVVYCWGDDFFDTLGNGPGDTTQQSPGPVVTTGISGDTRFSDLGGGSESTCGVTLDAAVYCWGDDSFEALGNGNGGDCPTPCAVETAGIAGAKTFTDVSGFGYSTRCGLATDGVALCWGADAPFGHLGDGGGLTDSDVPVEVDTSGL